MNTSKLPIPSFHYPSLDCIGNSSSSVSDLDDDEIQSLQTQYEEGAYEEAWNTYASCAQAKSKLVLTSVNTTRVVITESSQKVGNPELVEEASPAATRSTEATTFNESSQDENPILNLRRVIRSSSSLSIFHSSILTDSDKSSVATPPASLPQIAVTPSPPRRSRSNSSASDIVDASVSDSPNTRQRNSKRPGSTASAVSKKKTKSKLQHTTDFGEKTAETFAIPVHTLILGTHPSTKSLQAEKYYANPMNAFWWIAGDCLGFRRAKGVTSKGVPYKFTSDLKYDTSHILPYEMQLQRLCCKGFALKNTFQSCSRRGSSDRNIQSGVPNDIRQWCHDRKSIHRIVFSNGKSSFHQFAKHFKDWLKSGELVPSPHAASQEAFAKYPVGATITPPARTIECIVAVAVSPALATYSYSEKRDFWEESVFKPGLQDFAQWEHAAIAAGG